MTKASVCCTALISLAACGGDTTPSAPPTTQQAPGPTAVSVAIDQPTGFGGKITLNVRDQTVLTASARDASGAVLPGHPITWTSSTENVATVTSAGLVTAVGAGDANITATSDGKSDSRAVRVVALNLTAFHLTMLVTDDAGTPTPGASVTEIYYGAAPPGCTVCNVPYGNFVAGVTDASGSYVGDFVAAPEGESSLSGTPHTFAYVIAKKANYETDRRFVSGTSTTFTQTVHLHAMRQLPAGDSLSLTIASTDPVFQELDTAPPFDISVCRSVLVKATSDGLLTVDAVPVDASVAAPYVELDQADESDFFDSGMGTVSKSVHAGDVVLVRVAAFIKPGAPSLAFVLHTGLR